MKRAVAACLLTLAAGCGGSSAQTLAASSAQATAPVTASATPSARPTAATPQAPLEKAPVAGPPTSSRTAKTPPDPVTYPQPAPAGAGTAGTASAGPGHVTSAGPSPMPRPSPTVAGGTVTVTDDDSGSTIRVTAGQHVHVRLTSGTWDPPTSSDASVLPRRSSTGGYPSDQPVDATFDAASKGAADVSTSSDAACFHASPPCKMPQRLWQVHVVVG